MLTLFEVKQGEKMKEKKSMKHIPARDELHQAIDKARGGVPLYRFAEMLMTTKRFVRPIVTVKHSQPDNHEHE